MFSCVAASTARPVVVAARRNGDAAQQRRRSVQVRASSSNVASVAPTTVTTTVRNDRAAAMSMMRQSRRMGVMARAAEGEPTETTTAKDDVEDIPPWERREIEKKAAMEKGGLPWPAYLGLSVIVAIASIGSCFELTYGNPIFGVVQSDSGAYKPILFWFIVTGFPLTAFLWTKGIAGANEAAELQDKLDGY